MCYGGGDYEATNIKVKKGKVYGVNKIGGLVGYVEGESTFTNCSVDSTYIENYKVNIKDVITTVFGIEIGFYPQGEVGGLIGFIGTTSTITGSSVTNTTVNCYGQDDMSIGSVGSPGRHVNQYIGDIYVTSGETVTISGYTISNNKCSNRSDTHKWGGWLSNKYSCEIVGCIYYLSLLGDSKGAVNVNNSSMGFWKEQ